MRSKIKDKIAKDLVYMKLPGVASMWLKTIRENNFVLISFLKTLNGYLEDNIEFRL